MLAAHGRCARCPLLFVPCPRSPTVTTSPAIDDRLLRLEEKLTRIEDLVDELNRVVVRQQSQLEALARELTRQRRELEERPGTVASASIGEERPPHY